MNKNTFLTVILIILLCVLYFKKYHYNLSDISQNSQNSQNNIIQKKENFDDSDQILYREVIKGGVTELNRDIIITKKDIRIFDTHYRIKEDIQDNYKYLIKHLEKIDPSDLIKIGKDYDYISEYDTLYHYILIKDVDIDYNKLELLAHSDEKYAYYKEIIDDIHSYIKIVEHREHKSW